MVLLMVLLLLLLVLLVLLLLLLPVLSSSLSSSFGCVYHHKSRAMCVAVVAFGFQGGCSHSRKERAVSLMQ